MMWRQQRRWTSITENQFVFLISNWKYLKDSKRSTDARLERNRSWVGSTNVYSGKFNTVLIKVLMGQKYVVFFLFGDSLVSELYVLMFQNTLFFCQDIGVSPKRRNTNFTTLQKFKIKKWKYMNNQGKLRFKNIKSKYHHILCYCWYNLSKSSCIKHKHANLWKHEHG
jgi:hypothetical protein